MILPIEAIALSRAWWYWVCLTFFPSTLGVIAYSTETFNELRQRSAKMGKAYSLF
jgi:hypothetical protein